MTKLKPEVKALWLDALRGGKYRQGFARLHSVVEDEDRYCCLGVLTDLAVSQGIGQWVAPASHSQDKRWENPSGCSIASADLSPEVVEWAFEEQDDTDPGDPNVRPPDCERVYNLSELNDAGTDQGAFSFRQIAQLIEEQF